MAVTGDTIEREPFWTAFKQSVKRRNNIVHDGKTPTEAEAKESQHAATAFVEHVSRHAI
jgi:hypothetical protein